MSNKYEGLRNTIKGAISDTVVKVSEDKSRTSYTWSFDRVCSAVAVACQVVDARNLPSEMKEIVRFEFNKLKETILSNPDWILKGSSEGFAFTIDGIEARRTDRFSNDNISLENQLIGARVLLNKVGVAMAKASNAETTHKLNKRKQSIMRLMMALETEIASQNQVLKEIADEAKVAGVGARIDSVGKELVEQSK